MVMSLCCKWAAVGGRSRTAVKGRLSKSIRNRRATQLPAHFQRGSPGRGQLVIVPRCPSTGIEPKCRLPGSLARESPNLVQIPKFGIVLVVVLVLGALGFRDRKETDVLQLICSVSLIAKPS
jgi:hypothetical protein